MDILLGLFGFFWILSYFLFIPISITIVLLIISLYGFIELKKSDKENLDYQNLKKVVLKFTIITCICAVITIDLYITNLIFQKPIFHM